MGSPQQTESLAAIRRLAAQFLPAAELGPLTIYQPAVAGLSGSLVWLLSAEQTGPRYVLKQLPAEVPKSQIAWTQEFACHLAAAGLAQVPVPLQTLAASRGRQAVGRVAVDADGRTWQCLPFLPGKPIASPGPGEVAAAAALLAQLHHAAARFRVGMPLARPTGWQLRLAQLNRLGAGGLAAPAVGCTPDSGPEAAAWQRLRRARNQTAAYLAGFDWHKLTNRLTACGRSPPTQPVLRDCWWAHVLFERPPGSSQITGIIDLDAAGVDTVATDVARLLGSWQLAAADPSPPLAASWPDAFAAYGEIRQPAGDFPAEVQTLHDTAVICGLDRWFAWLFRERREFPDIFRVADRVESLLRALPAAKVRLERG